MGIPTTADDNAMTIYVNNIIAVWNAATAEQAAEGRSWYKIANGLAEMMAEGDTRAGAGVIAALSANKAWEINIRLAAQAWETGEVRGHVRDALGKAERIMLGEDPLVVLPMDSKTWNFYRCIADPDDADAVVIDRHAHDVAVGKVYGNQDRGLSNKRRYATLAHAYREAARRLGELPSTVQAVTWVAWRSTLSGTGTRGTLA
jgi:hypothetical protein